METADPRRRARENLTEIVSTVVTGVWLAALFTDQEWWLAAMLVGYVVVVPVVSLLFGDEDEESTADAAETPVDRRSDAAGGAAADDALDRLRERYAAGELTDEQFERKLDRLLETETLEDLEDRRDRGRDGDRTAPETDEEYEYSR